MRWCGSMSVNNTVYIRIIINIGCIGKYRSNMSLPQYGACIVCHAERDQVRGRVVGFVMYQPAHRGG